VNVHKLLPFIQEADLYHEKEKSSWKVKESVLGGMQRSYCFEINLIINDSFGCSYQIIF
jgi:hypothetical protein